MRQIEVRIRALWERLARENQRLLALLRAGHTLAEAEEMLKSEQCRRQASDGEAEENAER